MSSAGGRPGRTLGERLALQARDLVACRTATIAWIDRLERLLRRVESLPVPSTSPFRRVDAPLAEVWSNPPPVEPGDFDGPPSWPARSASEGGAPLAGQLRERLAPIVGPAVERIRVHQDEQADAVARHHDAAAVTVAQEIFFRRGRFRPREPEGIALLAHEALHVVEALRPNSSWRRATAAGATDEEAAADQLGRLAAQQLGHATAGAPPPASPARATGAWSAGHHLLPHLLPHGQTTPPGSQSAAAPHHHSSRLPHGPGPLPAAAPPAGLASPSPASRPMAAPAHQPVDAPDQGAAPRPDLGAAPDAIYRDLLRRMRVELERGA